MASTLRDIEKTTAALDSADVPEEDRAFIIAREGKLYMVSSEGIQEVILGDENHATYTKTE
jgi:hypothetical protein